MVHGPVFPGRFRSDVACKSAELPAFAKKRGSPPRASAAHLHVVSSSSSGRLHHELWKHPGTLQRLAVLTLITLGLRWIGSTGPPPLRSAPPSSFPTWSFHGGKTGGAATVMTVILIIVGTDRGVFRPSQPIGTSVANPEPCSSFFLHRVLGLHVVERRRPENFLEKQGLAWFTSSLAPKFGPLRW